MWERQGLTRRLARFLWLEREVSEGRGILTEGTLRVSARLKRLNESSDQHLDVKQPGELLSQDLYQVGHIEGAGKIYLQSAVDGASSVGFAKLCPNKLPIHSVALLHEKVLPFFVAHQVPVKAVLTDTLKEMEQSGNVNH